MNAHLACAQYLHPVEVEFHPERLRCNPWLREVNFRMLPVRQGGRVGSVGKRGSVGKWKRGNVEEWQRERVEGWKSGRVEEK